MINLKLLDLKLKELSSKKKGVKRTSTNDLKLLIASLFEGEESIFCYANGIENNDYVLINSDKEFVFDLIVVREEVEEKSDDFNSIFLGIDYITNTLLAMESEFHGGLFNVVEDFQKLLISNADEKILVFRCHLDDLDKWNQTFLIHLKKYKARNGVFHFICELTNRNEFKRYTIDSLEL